jgi:hypothetical protein
MLDSTVLSPDDCVELLAGAARAFWRTAERPTGRGAGPDGSDRP